MSRAVLVLGTPGGVLRRVGGSAGRLRLGASGAVAVVRSTEQREDGHVRAVAVDEQRGGRLR